MHRRSILTVIGFLVLISSNIYSQAYLDRHSAVQSDSWLSNSKTLSPNNSRGTLHWIRYDLGETYSLHKSKFWNINVPGLTNAGARTIYIDYSLDGVVWNEFGRLILDQATGNSFYEGQDGPDFSGVTARYLLFNIMNNHGHATMGGLAEWRIESTPVTVSVDDQKWLQQLELFASPNPFNTSTNITLKGQLEKSELRYQLTDVTGKIFLSDKVPTNQITISGNGLNAGMYYFSIIHNSGVKTIPLEILK